MRFKILAVIFLACFCSSALAQDAKPTADNLGWLAGCWVNADTGPEVTEHWLKPAGGMMMGMGRTVKDGRVTTYEFTRMYQEANGEIFFAAKLPKQEEVAFKLIKWADNTFVFENAAHDFPQRVIYRQDKNGQLAGRIEGKNNGKVMGFDFPMKRAACE
jgi:Domain of unknown function (DUF6265)